MADSPEIRVSDADRQLTIDRLQAAYAEGRLTDDELSDRIEAALGARVESDLSILEADLPIGDPPAVAAEVVTASAEPVYSNLFAMVRPLLAAPIICTVIYLITNPGGYFWPVWVWFGVMVPVIIAYTKGARG